MKKRIVSLLSVVLMLCVLAMPLMASAEPDNKAAEKKEIEVTIGSFSAKQGDEIDVPVTIDKNPGIWGINWKIYYDSQILRFDGIEFRDEFSELGLLDTNQVKYPVVINGMGSSVTENVDVTGEIAVIHFKVYVGVALGDTEITMKADIGNNINVDAEDIGLKVNTGKITVTKGLTSSPNKEDYPPKDPLKEAQKYNTPVGSSSKSSEGGVKWWWFIIGAVILLGVVVVIWLFSGSDESDEDGEENPVSAVPVNSEVTPVVPSDEPAASSEADDEAAFLAMLEEADESEAAEEELEEAAEAVEQADEDEPKD